MKNILKTVVIIVIMLTPLLVGCSRPEPPLRIGTNLWTGYEPLYLARNLGYFEGTPIRLAEYRSATDVISAFRNESIEAAALTLDEALLLLQDDFDLKVILALDYSNGADALVVRPEINDMVGLRGKKVGMEGMALGAYVLTRALDSGGLTPSDVTIVPVSASEHEKAFKTDSVDAVITFEPALTRILEQGGKKIFDSSMMPGEILDVLVVRTDVLKKQPNAAREIIKNWFKALDYMKKDPKDASERIARRSHITGEQFLESLKGLHFPDLVENSALLDTKTPGIMPPARRLMDVMFESRLIRKKVDLSSMVDAAPLMGGRP